MEFYYDEIDGDVLIIKADGGLNADTTDQFVESIEKLVTAGLANIIVDCQHDLRDPRGYQPRAASLSAAD